MVCENWDKEPVLGRVENILSDTVEIVWLDGDYQTAWKTARHRDPTHKGRMVDWRDTIPKSSIILFAFTLTAKNHLRKKTVEHMKKLYAQNKS